MENYTNSSCSRCSELSKEIQTIKTELKKCKNSFIELENRLNKADVSGKNTKCIINEEVGDVRGQCDCNEDDKMGIKTSSSEVFTLSQLETELKQFYEFCKENNLTDEEIANICKPLLLPIKTFNKKYIRYFAVLFTMIAILYFLSYFESVQWHYSAIARLFLIELLPFWNWKALKNEKCLINPLGGLDSDSRSIQDCTFCEYIQAINVMDSHQPDVIYQKYIKLHKPVILEDGLENWMEPVDFKVLLEDILNDDILSQSVPCNFKSNLYYGTGNLYQSLSDVKNNEIFFVHFQNCEFDAVKAFRKYFQRPKFLAAEILPVQYNWLMASNKYRVEKYKKVPLNDQITVVGQFSGKTNIVLHPNECSDDCEPLKIELVLGEVLIFTGVWNMEYKPDPEGLNLAVVLETH